MSNIELLNKVFEIYNRFDVNGEEEFYIPELLKELEPFEVSYNNYIVTESTYMINEYEICIRTSGSLVTNIGIYKDGKAIDRR